MAGSMHQRLYALMALFVVLSMSFCRAAHAQGEPEELVLTTADSVRIAAYWYERTTDAPVAVLIHNGGYNHHAWQPLLGALVRNGFHVLTLDLRGHGDSKELEPEIHAQLVRRDTGPFSKMIFDVEAAIQWLLEEKGFAPESVALVGGEFGGNLAISALARNPKLRAAVALSPARVYYNTPVMEDVKKCRDKPLYVILTKQELSYGGQQIADLMRENDAFTLKVFPRADFRGVELLNLSWNVERLIVEWLREQFDL